MISIARTFGAPVIDPQGKAARSTSTAPAPAGKRAPTSETSWWIVGKLSTRNRAGTATDPGTATRDRSLRIRSTIIRFSARRSEEHTSELQSLMRISYAVFCLKNKKIHNTETKTQECNDHKQHNSEEKI